MSQNTRPDLNDTKLNAALAEKLAQTTALLRDIASNFAPAVFASLGGMLIGLPIWMMRFKRDVSAARDASSVGVRRAS